MSIAITTINGYPAPFAQRYALYRAAGIDKILLWWGDDEAETRADRVRQAHEAGLAIEHAHASTDLLNALWLPGDEGESTLRRLSSETEDCARLGISTLVFHLTNGSLPPPVTELGLSRLEHLIRMAEGLGIRLAVENVRLPEHVACLLDTFDSPALGLCYDSGHAHFWSPDFDWLGRYGHRLMTLHLHDNHGDRDAHLLPFDGCIDWPALMSRIAQTGYRGCLPIEAEMRTADCDNLPDFLRRAAEAGHRLERMLKEAAP